MKVFYIIKVMIHSRVNEGIQGRTMERKGGVNLNLEFRPTSGDPDYLPSSLQLSHSDSSTRVK